MSRLRERVCVCCVYYRKEGQSQHLTLLLLLYPHVCTVCVYVAYSHGLIIEWANWVQARDQGPGPEPLSKVLTFLVRNSIK